MKSRIGEDDDARKGLIALLVGFGLLVCVGFSMNNVSHDRDYASEPQQSAPATN